MEEESGGGGGGGGEGGGGLPGLGSPIKWLGLSYKNELNCLGSNMFLRCLYPLQGFNQMRQV